MEQTKLKKRKKGRKKKFGDINLAEYSKKHMAPKGTNLASVIYVCDEREKIITFFLLERKLHCHLFV